MWYQTQSKKLWDNAIISSWTAWYFLYRIFADFYMHSFFGYLNQEEVNYLHLLTPHYKSTWQCLTVQGACLLIHFLFFTSLLVIAINWVNPTFIFAFHSIPPSITGCSILPPHQIAYLFCCVRDLTKVCTCTFKSSMKSLIIRNLFWFVVHPTLLLSTCHWSCITTSPTPRRRVDGLHVEPWSWVQTCGTTQNPIKHNLTNKQKLTLRPDKA